ncbi:MAG: stage V sporulation protein AB [Epulopiscium sp.]|nr:stage V sporulation protein AB [Candidatus Epulonipiscium sp.]
MLNKIFIVLVGLSGGIVVSAGIFALITALGIVPRLIERSNTRDYIRLFENCIIFGGITGTILSFWPTYIPLGKPALVVIGVANGIFIGHLLVALAEFINVLPIMNRRFNLTGGIGIIIVSLGLGKSIGSLLYWLVPTLQQL